MVASDPASLSAASKSLPDLATEAHVQRGGAVVATSCHTCEPGSPMDRAEMQQRGIAVAGFVGLIGLSEDGTLHVPMGSKNGSTPGATRPPVSTGPESGRTIGEIILGAERRVNPAPPPPNR